MSATEVSKQQPAGGIEISQSDLLQAASSMGPSVSDSERRKYEAMYVLNILKCFYGLAAEACVVGVKSEGVGGGGVERERVKRNLSPMPFSLFQISVSPTSYPSLLLWTPAKKARLVECWW